MPISPFYRLVRSARPLSARERDVLALLPTGASNQEIAQHLKVSVNTVKSHVQHINTVLGTRNRTEAAARARDVLAKG